MTTKESFTVSQPCPVVQHRVTLTGRRTSLSGMLPAVSYLTCDHLIQCYGVGPIDKLLPGCLLGRPVG